MGRMISYAEPCGLLCYIKAEFIKFFAQFQRYRFRRNARSTLIPGSIGFYKPQPPYRQFINENPQTSDLLTAGVKKKVKKC